MIKMTLQLCIALLMFLGIARLQAQETIPVTGGNATGSGGSISYTIGQTFYITNSGTNGSIAEGVQQPFEISVVIGIEEANDIKLSLSAYPNPTTDILTLRIDNFDASLLCYQLFDIQEKLLETKNIDNNQTNIDMSHLVPATYFLKIISNTKELKTFKIVKN